MLAYIYEDGDKPIDYFFVPNLTIAGVIIGTQAGVPKVTGFFRCADPKKLLGWHTT